MCAGALRQNIFFFFCLALSFKMRMEGSEKISLLSFIYVQGNYVTKDSNGICHLMPHRHLPEWREGDGWAFVHRGSWIPNKALDNTMPATELHLQEVNIKWWMTLWKALWQTQVDIIAWFRPELPQCTNACSSSSLHSGRCHHGIM